MLALLNFNKRLGWVVAACVLWSLIGLTVAAGRGARGIAGPEAPFRLSMGLAENSIIVDGQVLSIIEDEELLTITVRPRPDGKQQAYRPGGEAIAELPANLELVYAKRGDKRRGPPEIKLLSGSMQANEVAKGRFGLVTKEYAIKFAPGHLRIMPKPADARPGWWRRFFQKEPRDQGNPLRPGEGMREKRPGDQPRPGEKRRPGDGQRTRRNGPGEPGKPPKDGQAPDRPGNHPPPNDGQGKPPNQRPPR